MGKGWKETVDGFFRKLVPLIFSAYDSRLPNRVGDWSATPAPHFKTPVPDYDLSVNGSSVVLRCRGVVLEATPGGFLFALGVLWGLARGKAADGVPCARFLYSVGVEHPEGDVAVSWAVNNLPEDYLSLARGFLQMGAAGREEAELLLYQISKALKARREFTDRPAPVTLAEFQKDPSLAETFYDPFQFSKGPSRKTTRRGALEELAADPKNIFGSVLDKYRRLQRVHGLIHDTTANLVSVRKAFAPFLTLWDDGHPAVRDLTASTLDLLVNRLFLEGAYEAALPDVDLLMTRGINSDLNVARKWECLTALGRDAEAEKVWGALAGLVDAREPAPPLWEGLHSVPPGYDAWKLLGWMRLARLHREAGGAPGAKKSNKRTVDHGARGREMIEKATKALREMEPCYPGHRMFREVRETLAVWS